MEHQFDIVVQKYGGSSVAEPQKIKSVAGYIKDRLLEKQRLCVVVSAMGNTTNQLISLAQQVNPDPPKRELDMLVSCGERSSMALLAMALNHLGVKALSLTGSQSGIITDECHSGADLIAIRPHRVLEAFQSHHVVIIAGFQGMSRTREITTLKRGGSDTTAVAMAAALKAQVCEIYTDVPGVMEMDPRVVPHARAIPALSQQRMCSMSLYGAKVLAHDAAKLAHDLGVQLLIAESGRPMAGTRVDEIPIKGRHTNPIVAITHLRGVVRLELTAKNLGTMRPGYFLCGVWRSQHLVGYASNDIAQELQELKTTPTKARLALITLHVAHPSALLEISAHLLELFDNNNLEIVDVIVGGEQIFVIISDSQLNQALLIAHAGLLERGVLA